MSKTITIKKGTILEHQGTPSSKVYKVISGLLRSYVIDDKGKEYIFLFAPEGWTIADSQPIDAPSDLFIDALEDSVVEVHSKENGHNSTNTEPLFNRIRVLQKRILMLMSSSAIERYEHFIFTYPEIVQRVPQKMIASYLGITPEALSATKKKQTKKV
jgi:CRP-like cAMP-binding protein